MHVVIADSGETMLRIIAAPLRKNGDKVALFTDGRRALEYIKSDPTVDVLLAGFELENMPGTELCWEVQIDPAGTIPVYVIVMSSSTETAKLVEALDSGADDFLRKPFGAEELKARLRAAARVRQSHLRLIELATSDPLTGVSNRRSFFEQAQKCLENVVAGEAVSALMLDIDHFKSVNDTHGHDIGDKVLCEVTAAIEDLAPVFGRLGGEEFAALLPGMNCNEAFAVAEKMRETVADLSIQAEIGAFSVTCSIGAAELVQGDDIDKLLKKADTALYEAKQTGRNKTVRYQPFNGSIPAVTVNSNTSGHKLRQTARRVASP